MLCWINFSTSDGITTLVTINADLSRVPSERLIKQMGKDRRQYYVIPFSIRVTYFSAYTKYELVHDGINYGLVAAEYV